MIVHFNIGSNLGEPRRNVARAAAILARKLQSPSVSFSAIVESKPWGFNSSNIFANIGVMASVPDTTTPLQLLDYARAVEAEMAATPHRNPDGSYRDRTIDVDVISAGRIISTDPSILLPHPRAALRPFVMTPLIQLDPAAVAWITSLQSPQEP